MSDSDQAAWQKLSQVAVKGAQYNSPQRQPHPKCLEGTRVILLNHIYEFLDNPEKSRLIWLHGTAGVGKSAVAFTVAERMKGLKVKEQTSKEKRLAGTFFFSRKHADRCTTGNLFATLVYQLASNFPSIKDDVTRAIRENPAILDLDMSLEDQMEALFLQPLRGLQLRLHGCPPLMFAVDALDECASKDDIVDLISLLGQALRDPGLPVIHILFTSRLEPHIRNAFQKEEVHPLVCEIPVKISGSESDVTIISLDGADVDKDIYIFLEHSFKELRTRIPNVPQPKEDELARLANRAGRRFIVASTMMKFIDDGYNDPRDRLQLMLKLTNNLLPGTEVYKLYDHILFTCADPKRAYRHLSVVVRLADPLPMSQISELLGPGEGRDVETALLQLRSVMDIPTDRSLPVNIYHSSVRDYASDPSNCSLSEVQCIMPPHSILAYSSFRLMIEHLPKGTALLDALSKLESQSQAAQSHDPQELKHTLDFIVKRPEPLQVLEGLLWLRGNRDSESRFWLGSRDGHVWLQTQGGQDWLWTQGGQDWLQTRGRKDWLQTQGGKDWLQNQGGKNWLQTQGGKDWLQTHGGKDWLQTQAGKDWLQTKGGQDWLQTKGGQDWLQTWGGQDWLQTQGGQDRLLTQGEQDWLLTQRGQDWLWTQGGQDWMRSQGGRGWLRTQGGQGWLQTQQGQDCLWTQGGQDWLQIYGGQDWLWTQGGQDWLQIRGGQGWLQTQGGQGWLQTQGGQDWLRTQGGQDWLWTQQGQYWLQTQRGQYWLQIHRGQYWQQTWGGQDWLQTKGGQGWLRIQGGQNWLQTQGGQDWLQTQGGQDWLQTKDAWDWLQSNIGQDWLQTSCGQVWQSTHAESFWLTMEEFSSTLGEISKDMVVPEVSLLPTFQAIQKFQGLPDFLIFPAFLALRYPHSNRPSYALSRPQHTFPSNVETVHAMKTFTNFAKGARERSQCASDALNYACQNWAIHLSRTPNSRDDRLNKVFKAFWDCHLLSWLERQWCLKGLCSSFIILSEGLELAKKHLLANANKRKANDQDIISDACSSKRAQ